MSMSPSLKVSGAGGGGGSSSKPYTPYEAPNTLQAVVKGRILDLVAYGPIFGLADGLKSVYLEDTPVQNADNTFNFDGIKIETREGLPDQDYIPGFAAVENTAEVGTEVLFANPPVRAVSNNDADAVSVTVQLAALVQSTDKGDSVNASVTVMIDYRSGTGSWVTAVTDTIIGKTTSPFPKSYRVELKGSGPYSIRVRRGNAESTTPKIQDKLTWTLLTEIIDRKFSYPHMALVGLTVNSKLFGTQMPSRSYDMKLSIISVPSNYTPTTRAYTGIWDGTFKQAWTDNPAWAFMDLAMHPIIGADIKFVDKWLLYRIAQYCDELVPDGYGGMEPRFTINTIFAAEEDAQVALSSLASCFRGMAYWGTNTVVPVGDMPTTPRKIVTLANVVDGEISYVGTALSERHSVCTVMWNDPSDQDKLVPEIYEDPDSIVAFGWKETRVTAVGCNSRGQALRMAKWILYSERMETQTISYKATLDHADLRPGDIIEVADPDYQGARLAGRVVTGGIRSLELDQVPPPDVLAVTANWVLSVLQPDGTVAKSEVSTFKGNTVNLKVGLSAAPEPGFMWALSATEINLPQFRVVSNKEGSDGTYSITATEYDPNKYAFVEQGLKLPDRPTSLLPTGPVAPPMDLSFEVYKYFAGNSEHQGLLISWTPPKDVRVDSFVLDVMDPTGGGAYRTVYNGPGTSYDLKDAIGGRWSIRVRSISSAGVPSEWANRDVQIAMLLLPTPPDSVLVKESTFEVTLSPQSAYPNAVWEFWRSLVPLEAGQIETNASQLPTGTYLVDVGLRSGRTYFYYVRGTNQYGLSAWYSVQATTKEDFDDIMDHVTEEIINGSLSQEINNKIEVIAGATATEVVDAAVAGLNERIDKLQDFLEYKSTGTYVKDDVVRVNNQLWQAIKPVPADPSGANAPPNANYWANVGQTLTTANGQATQIQKNTTDILNVDGKVQAMSSSLSVLEASYRDDNADGLLEGAIAAVDSRARSVQEITTVAEEGKATANRTSILEAGVADANSRIATVETLVVTNEASTANRLTSINSQLGKNSAAIVTEQETRATQIEAVSKDISTVQATVQGNTAAIKAESQTRATQIEAVSRDVSTVQATVQGNTAAIKAESQTRATQIEAVSRDVSTVQAAVDANTASVQVVSEANAKLSGDLKTMYAIKLQLTTNGTTYAAGMGLDITTSGGITQSQIIFQADRIAMLNVASGKTVLPWFLEGGNVYMNTAIIKYGSISFLQIGDDMQSTDYKPGKTGWKLSKGGSIEFNGPAAGGGRLTMTNQLIQIFSVVNGVERLKVRIGIW